MPRPGASSRPHRAPAHRVHDGNDPPRASRASARIATRRRARPSPSAHPPAAPARASPRRAAPAPAPAVSAGPAHEWQAVAEALLHRISVLEASSTAPPSNPPGAPPPSGPPFPVTAGPPSLSAWPATGTDLASHPPHLPWLQPLHPLPLGSGSREYGENNTRPVASHSSYPPTVTQWPWPALRPSNPAANPAPPGPSWPCCHHGHPTCSLWPTHGPLGPSCDRTHPSANPAIEASLPLGDHLLQSTRDKIIKGEYVDIFGLLNRDSYPTDVSKLDDLDKDRARRKKPPRTWENWLPAFLIYAGVSVRARPELALPLLQYLDLIYRAHVDFPGDAWKFYDEEFRMRAALRPGMRWDEPNSALWLQYMTPSRPASGDRFDCGHLVQHPPEQPSAHRTSAPTSSTPSRTFCWEFAAHGRCNKKQCRYKHECLICLGKHGSSSCPVAANLPGSGAPPSRTPASLPSSTAPPN